MGLEEAHGPRRVLVGVGAQGRSTVVADGPVELRAMRSNGSVVHDLWQQPVIPAKTTDEGFAAVEPGALPRTGAIVRFLTIPPGTSRERPTLDLHTTPALIVLTVITGRTLVVVEAGEVVLEPGDTAVIPGSMHDIGNVSDVAAQVIFTVFPLTTE